MNLIWFLKEGIRHLLDRDISIRVKIHSCLFKLVSLIAPFEVKKIAIQYKYIDNFVLKSSTVPLGQLQPNNPWVKGFSFF